MAFQRIATVTVLAWALCACAAVSGRPPSGAEGDIDPADKAAMQAIGKKVQGKIVWSSSRIGNHDIFMMNTDGSNVTRLTKGDHVDWFPRFSPDGKRIMFIRSKKGWVAERDANADGKWDLFVMAPDGSGVKKLVDNASWGNWLTDNEIVFVRRTKVTTMDLGTKKETVLLDGDQVDDLNGALLQQPQISPDRKYVALTLRGGKRETGVYSMDEKTWTRTGDGCQINWTPDGSEIYWVNPSGNGGSEVFRIKMTNGKPSKEYDYDEMLWIDIPGRRSHEYFPQLTRDGKWLVWAATQRGHDHDIADYEIYIWEVGTSPEKATRLTYHSGNDRWPNLYIP